MGGGGGGSDSGSGGYDAAPMQYQQQQSRRKREEKALGGATGGSYVTSSDGTPSIVRSSSGSGVLTSEGVMRKQAFQEAEYQTQSSGSAVAQDTIRQGAIYELEKRKEATLPGAMGVISKLNLQRQIDALKAGGTPTKALTVGGRYVTVGVQTKDGGTLGRESAGGSMARMFDSQTGDTSSPEVTPEVTSEVVPDDTGVGLTGTGKRGSRRPTRGKRSGQAGDFGEGILIRNTSK